MDSKKRMVVFAVAFMVLAVTAVGLFAVVLTQRNAAPENASADIAPLTETVELDTTKITLVKTSREILTNDNIIAGETYEVSGKVRRYPTPAGGNITYYNYSNSLVGIIVDFPVTVSGIGTSDYAVNKVLPTIYTRIKNDNSFSFRFVAAETTDIGKSIQIKPDGLYTNAMDIHYQIAYTTLTSGKGYLGTASKVVKK